LQLKCSAPHLPLHLQLERETQKEIKFKKIKLIENIEKEKAN
jgi:hypothetical protein